MKVFDVTCKCGKKFEVILVTPDQICDHCLLDESDRTANRSTATAAELKSEARDDFYEV
jgi:hypothetical protein